MNKPPRVIPGAETSYIKIRIKWHKISCFEKSQNYRSSHYKNTGRGAINSFILKNQTIKMENEDDAKTLHHWQKEDINVAVVLIYSKQYRQSSHQMVFHVHKQRKHRENPNIKKYKISVIYSGYQVIRALCYGWGVIYRQLDATNRVSVCLNPNEASGDRYCNKLY